MPYQRDAQRLESRPDMGRGRGYLESVEADRDGQQAGVPAGAEQGDGEGDEPEDEAPEHAPDDVADGHFQRRRDPLRRRGWRAAGQIGYMGT